MPRVRSDDYETKSQAILDSAAALFAKEGYPGAKMQDVASACGATKSMLYHYFPTKDDLLYAMLKEHLEKTIAAIEEVAAMRGSGLERFNSLVQVYAQKSAQSRRRHVTAMNDMKYLPKAMQAPLLVLEKKITDLIAAMLRELKPGLPGKMYKPYTMHLLGMLNWTDYWYRPGGELKPKDLCAQISHLFLRGFLADMPPA
ncbi:TetR/AcrR family transcriptional regulator [Paraburkholderia sp. USG1]|uniref:TetR/AcrR family transcriptional regulator n=1 Tax=Paraburkholderia sp. USG1 TaxID=2952268 RepID=UPI00286780AC|nr:TetR/AcrR family transcriptional regulator [Paraburkholderia sp. USG1]MDR8394718.1 TetR/AcrR family transcriptional regulator [Paraburkholderia sp. USG1]